MALVRQGANGDVLGASPAPAFRTLPLRRAQQQDPVDLPLDAPLNLNLPAPTNAPASATPDPTPQRSHEEQVDVDGSEEAEVDGSEEREHSGERRREGVSAGVGAKPLGEGDPRAGRSCRGGPTPHSPTASVDAAA
jgi:hypothetical protein